MDVLGLILLGMLIYCVLVISCLILNWRNVFESTEVIHRYNISQLNTTNLSNIDLIYYEDALINNNPFKLFISKSPLDFIKSKYHDKVRPFLAE